MHELIFYISIVIHFLEYNKFSYNHNDFSLDLSECFHLNYSSFRYFHNEPNKLYSNILYSCV